MIISNQLKWGIGVVLAMAIISALTGAGYKLYNLGWDAAMAKQTNDQNIAINAAVDAARKEWQSTNKITSTGIGNVNDTKQKLEVIAKQATTIQAPLCPDVGSDYRRVYNDTIRTIKAGADTSRSVSDGQVPAQSPH